MKKNTLIILFLIFSIYSFSQCPLEGNGKNTKEKHANFLKNRSIKEKCGAKILNIDSLLIVGQDSSRFQDSSYVSIVGYFIEYKPGRSESCNCNSPLDVFHDVHIYIGKTPDSKKEDCVICEATPPFKIKFKLDWKNFIGKKVMIEGYLFYDVEHKGNAKNTCKICTNVWRATVWEIHPITCIELIE